MVKLQPLLSQYLLENSTLPLTGVGQLSIERKAAMIQEAGSTIAPPHTNILFSKRTPSETDLEKLSGFVATKLSIPIQQAVELLKENGNLLTLPTENEKLQWPPFGHFHKEENGSFAFLQVKDLQAYLPAIMLQQHQPQPKTPLVEEEEEEEIETTVTSAPIYELEEPAKKDNWWIWAIVIFTLSLLLILLRFGGWM